MPSHTLQEVARHLKEKHARKPSVDPQSPPPEETIARLQRAQHRQDNSNT